MKSGLSRDELAQISAILQAVPAVEKAVLFGSRAMGLARAGSDVDLMLYGDELKMQDIMQVSSLLEETALPYQFDLLRSDVKNPDLLEHIKQYGKVIFEKERRHINEASLNNEANDLNKFLEYELGQVCSRLSSGKSISAKDLYEAGKYPVYGGNGLRGYADLANFEGDCAIIGRQGAFCGNVRYFSGKAYMTEHAVIVCANSANDTRFIAYLLSIMDLGRLSGQSAQPGLSVKTLAQQKIRLPSLEIQKEIASILSALDDKIANNKAINHHLEQMAQAIFKSWFVDFEPSQPFTDIVQVLGGGTPKTGNPEYWGASIPFFTPKDALGTYVLTTEKYLTESGLENCNSRLYPVNTVFVTARGTVGKLAMAGAPMAMNQSCYALIGNGEYGQHFVYHLALKTIENLKHKANGAVFDAIVTRDFESELVPAPPCKIVKSFEEKVTPIYAAILNNAKESVRLAALRDTLLPRLMSGELSVADLGGGK